MFRRISEIRVLVTGGTLDKTYDAIAGTLGFSRTNVLSMLEQARVDFPRDRVETVLLKDSLEMVQADRDAILRACAAATEPRLVITHGTDTMIETARHLAEAELAKTVVLVGALVPYSFSNSDSLFNLGAAFIAAQLLSAGVYVTMHGRVFVWNQVRKNRKLGVFEASGSAE